MDAAQNRETFLSASRSPLLSPSFQPKTPQEILCYQLISFHQAMAADYIDWQYFPSFTTSQAPARRIRVFHVVTRHVPRAFLSSRSTAQILEDDLPGISTLWPLAYGLTGSLCCRQMTLYDCGGAGCLGDGLRGSMTQWASPQLLSGLHSAPDRLQRHCLLRSTSGIFDEEHSMLQTVHTVPA